MSSQGSPSSSNHEEGPAFTCFLWLPVELQIRVWEHAFPSNRSPRVAFLRVHSAPDTFLSHEVLNLNNLDARIGWPVSNPRCLANTDPVSSLLATSHRSRTVTLKTVERTLDTPWLRRVGLAEAHVDPDIDIVFFGGNGDVLHDIRSMTAMTLVLGNEFPNIMVPAHAFSRHAFVDLNFGNVEPVHTALAALRDVDPVWHELFRPGPNALPHPGLPRNIYFLLGPISTTRISNYRAGSDCLHFEDLAFSPPLATEPWHLDHASSLDEQSIHQRIANVLLVKEISQFWHNVQNVPGFTGAIPNVSFVQIRA